MAFYDHPFMRLCSSSRLLEAWLMMISLCLLIGSLHSIERSRAEPIRVPDLRRCKKLVFSESSLSFNCCLPVPANYDRQTVQDFILPTVPAQRIRWPAHRADKAAIAKYRRAYELMRALPASDPRSLAVQANIHCAFCTGAYKQPGTRTDVDLQMHLSWLFLPWHRWYLYFHERILGSLVGDPTFALAFWNWDNQLAGEGANMVPPMFNGPNSSSLYDPKRDQRHLPPALVSLSLLSNATSPRVIVQENLNYMYQSVVKPSTAELFMGGAYRTGTDIDFNSTAINGGSLEDGVHASVHAWMGDPKLELGQDMGGLATAARDPIFYAHHANVDRLWEVWETLPGGRRQPPSDTDFLNAEFLFYDEHANLVKVKARDALDSRGRLGVSYQAVDGDLLWRNFRPRPTSRHSAVAVAQDDGVLEVGAASTNADEWAFDSLQPDQSARTSSPHYRAMVKRPSTPPGPLQSEVLVIQRVHVRHDRFTQLLAFVNLPDADENTLVTSAEFLGSFNILPMLSSHHLLTNIRFEIGDNLRRIGIQNDTLVVITIVIKTPLDKTRAVHESTPIDVKIGGMEIRNE